MQKRAGSIHFEAFADEWQTDKALMAALGLGIEPTLVYLFNETPTYEEFENWIIATGKPDPQAIDTFNRNFDNGGFSSGISVPKVLSNEQLEFWDKNGYIVLRNAIPKEDCEKTIEVICQNIGVNRDDPATWYASHKLRQGIMVQVFNDPQMEKNRGNEFIKQAYQQLYNSTNIWINTDRVGFNPPETYRWKFPGPRLHWDTKLDLPIPYSLQGILYLCDVAENQGAFSLVPGFQHKIDKWITSLNGSDPYHEDLYALGCIPIAANAGDFIIWHQALPHGSSPNTSTKPRFVQYFTYEPPVL